MCGFWGTQKFGLDPAFFFGLSGPSSRTDFLRFSEGARAWHAADAQIALRFKGMFRKVMFFAVVINHF